MGKRKVCRLIQDNEQFHGLQLRSTTSISCVTAEPCPRLTSALPEHTGIATSEDCYHGFLPHSGMLSKNPARSVSSSGIPGVTPFMQKGDPPSGDRSVTLLNGICQINLVLFCDAKKSPAEAGPMVVFGVLSCAQSDDIRTSEPVQYRLDARTHKTWTRSVLVFIRSFSGVKRSQPVSMGHQSPPRRLFRPD